MKARDGESVGRTYPNFGRTPIGGLKKSRKGKHYQLLTKILEDLRTTEPGYAVKIPLSSAAGVPVLNLRSAVTRAASKEGIAISTSADDNNFYVWKARKA